MILVTVGTEKFPFDRLMQWIDHLLSLDLLGDEVVVQNCTYTFRSQGVSLLPVLKEPDFRDLIRQAKLVVAHCGEGTVLTLDAMAPPFILVPRSKRYREHVDDHQVELAQALASMEVPIAWGPADLVRFLASPRKVSISDLSTAAARAVFGHLVERFPV